MNKYLIIIIAICVSCSPSANKAKSKPEWVMRKPLDNDYYNGVAYANKLTSTNYVQSAKATALDDLISEISVNISSNSVLKQLDTGSEFLEEYESKIKTTAKNEIQDYEIAGSWEDQNNYWVYYRLSRQRYAQIQAEKARNARTLALDNYSRGKKAESRNEISEAIKFYLAGFTAILPYLNEPNNMAYEGEEILLGNELYSSIQHALTDVSVKINKTNIDTERRLVEDISLSAFVESKSSNKPMANFPLKADFSLGRGVVHVQPLTNQEGKANVTISSILAKNTQQKVRVFPDVLQLAELQQGDRFMESMINNLIVPQSEIILNISNPIVFLSASELALGQKKNEEVTRELKKSLTQNGFDFTTDKKKADLWITLTVDTSKGRESGSIYSSMLNFSLDVVDRKTKTEIFRTGMDRIKGNSLSYERASNDAYIQLMERLEREVLNNLIKEILE